MTYIVQLGTTRKRARSRKAAQTLIAQYLWAYVRCERHVGRMISLGNGAIKYTDNRGRTLALFVEKGK